MLLYLERESTVFSEIILTESPKKRNLLNDIAVFRETLKMKTGLILLLLLLFAFSACQDDEEDYNFIFFRFWIL